MTVWASIRCECKKELTEHVFVTNTNTFEEGFRCVECGHFKTNEDNLAK
jgi:hypothetical protein